jgi:hypothetical protein
MIRIPRPGRLVAIARMDLRTSLSGRRFLGLGGITAALLAPAAIVRVEPPENLPETPEVTVLGDVPDAVLAEYGVIKVDGARAHLLFHRADDGTLLVRGYDLPPRVRRALDGDTPAIELERRMPDMPVPGRSALFALFAASVLTGGVSESIGGERSRKTLQALLAAAVTREEIVLGKWLAWAGYGVFAAMSAATVSIALGRVEPGWWLLPLPTVAMGSVALALYLVRHTTDVVSGAATSLRVLPALLTITGLLAWYYADDHPLVSAALPVGGALLAAGATWDGAAAPLVATASTLLFSAVLLARTARDLEQPAVGEDSWWRRLWTASALSGFAALGVWGALLAPLLWGLAGNQVLTDRLPRRPGLVAAGLVLVGMSAVHAARSRDARDAVGLTAPRPWAWPAAVGVGLALALAAGPLSGLASVAPEGAAWAAATDRLVAALFPGRGAVDAFLLGAVGQELFFRGWMQRLAGPVAATTLFVAVCAPLDPVGGLVIGGSMAALTHASGGVGPAIVARLLALAFALALPAVWG